MKLINYIIVAAGCFAMAACTSSDILDNVSKDAMSMTKTEDSGLEIFEVKLDVAGTLAEKLGDKKDKVQNLILSGLVDADDVTTFRSMAKLTVLDMKGVEFAESDKTYTYNSHFYDYYVKVIKGEISGYMFWNLRSIVSVILPSDIVAIHDYAFSGTSISTIILPEGLKIIGPDAFNNTKLSLIEIPRTVKDMSSSGIFADCAQLKTIDIPDGVTVLGGACFYGCKALEEVHLPSNLTVIGAQAFYDCKALEKVHLSSNLTVIGARAFQGCASLKSIDIPDMVVEIGGNAFEGSAIESIELPDNMQVISAWAFFGCRYLREIKLPAKLLEIDDYAFQNSGLKSIDIPPSTKRIGFGAFGGAWRLSAIFVNGKTTLEDVFSGTPNCVYYLSYPETNISSALYNIIINGMTPSLKFIDGWSDFFCFKEFKTIEATYTRTFDLKTIPGQSVGWYSLSLPYDVTTITHEDGRILAPFNSGVPNSHPFWLRKLTANGFENATSIKAGESYIIAMPNNEKYAKEYNLAGKITFSARDATNYITIPVTTYKKMEGSLFDFNPSYECQDKNASVYVLNEEGSAFVRSLRDSRPFEAYVTNKALSTKAPDMFFIGSNIKTRSTHTISDKPNIDDM